ncbi:MAG: hypothetical protein IJQ68_00340 [Methanobrevibacter sp.]|uniref:hypothetical protein n=1 Tax=Methanobrevibacter sp. TaxID=66852 RepID=UPI0025DA30DA|nr:hypothetical protein [Methanobrevibacter sp.]MBR0270434.1 hypothetical protein [Methanobrevibacter sp.]
MALNIKAPLFETAEIQRFFEGSDSSEKLMVNISATGDFGVKFRGIIDGKEKNFSQNMDHIIILFEQYNCFATYRDVKRVSKFMPRGYFS